MANVLSRYVGNLHEKGRSDLNLASFVVASTNDEAAAISELSRQAREFMEIAPLATATLAVTKDGAGFRTIELENQKHAHRP
jgi:hypothetical protein